MKLTIFKDADELTSSVADWICTLIQETLLKQPRFTIALSGGNTPKQLFSKLAADPYVRKIDWSRMHIFWGDERCVPFDDERNNANMAFRELLSKVEIPKSQIHRIYTEIAAEDSSVGYEMLLREVFNDTSKTFNLVLLGLGEDGHTLSLFPGKYINEKERWVVPVFLPSQDMWRITLTPEVVNRSSNIAFLVSGKSKAPILEKVLNKEQQYPANLIQPTMGELYWFVDEEAASTDKRN